MKVRELQRTCAENTPGGDVNKLNCTHESRLGVGARRRAIRVFNGLLYGYLIQHGYGNDDKLRVGDV